MIYRRQLVALFIGSTLAGALPVRSLESCDPSKVIETLPYSCSGNTCDSSDTLHSYDSGTCRIPGVNYYGRDVVQKVRLNQGNQSVGFFLDVKGSADLVLALTNVQNNALVCVNSSTDFIGYGDEEISAANYTAGTYFLYVDSQADQAGPADHCGDYDLFVTGTNPVPDLSVDLSAPAHSVAGKQLPYTLKVENRGTLGATHVVVTQTLPDGVVWKSSPGCTPNGKTVSCSIGDLAAHAAPVLLTVTVGVNPGVRGQLTSSAEVTANEGSPTLPIRDEATTTVTGESDLSIKIDASLEPATAGKRLTYTLTVSNNGPSKATQVKATDTLPLQVSFFKASTGCVIVDPSMPNTALCDIPDLSVGESVTRTITVDVKPSSLGTIVNQAEVTAAEKEPTPNREPNEDTKTTTVKRETTLSVTTATLTHAIAGSDLTYEFTITNQGPSDSSGGTITDDLSPALAVKSWTGCQPDASSPSKCGFDSLAAKAKRTVTMTVALPSSLKEGILLNNTTHVKGNEDVSERISTKASVVEIQANLNPTLDALASVCSGENIVYTVTVGNDGPSDSPGATVKDMLLPHGLAFVSSPDDCAAANDIVTCTVPAIPAHSPAPPFRFVASPTGEVAVTNQVEVVSEHSRGGQSTRSQEIKTTLKPAADVMVTLQGPSTSVEPDGALAYTLKIAKNEGTATTQTVDVDLNLTTSLNPDPNPTDPDCEPPLACSNGHCELDFDLSAGSVMRKLCFVAPDSPGEARVIAKVSSTCDLNQSNNKAEVTTSIARSDDPDLSVAMTADAATVVAGDQITYTIKVTNQHETNFPDNTILVVDPNPSTVVFVSTNQPCVLSGGSLTCTAALPEQDCRQCTVTAVVSADDPPSLTTTAKVTYAAGADSVTRTASVTTPVLRGSLILPFFEIGTQAGEATTLFSLKNSSEDTVVVREERVPTAGNPDESRSEIDSKGIESTTLIDPTEDVGRSGYFAFTPIPREAKLSGDFIRYNPEKGTAGGALISTDSERAPSELCHEWSTRFFKLKGASSDFVFFVPGNSADKTRPVATGRVFNEAGDFVQELPITNAEEVFRIDRGTLDLLATYGSIEWTFRDGLIGNISAVHHRSDGDAVAMPGFCRDTLSADTTSFLYPGAEVTLRNEGEVPVEIGSIPFVLKGHAMKTYALDPAQEGVPVPGAVSGDFLRPDPGDLWGGPVPRQLCRRWSTRFIKDGEHGRTTRILVLPAGAQATGTVYDEQGNSRGPSLMQDKAELELPDSLPASGSIEWDFGEGVLGYAASVLVQSGDVSVYLPGVCLDSRPVEEDGGSTEP